MIYLVFLRSTHTSLIIPIYGIVLAFYQNTKWELEAHHIQWEMAQAEGLLSYQWLFAANIQISGELSGVHAVAQHLTTQGSKFIIFILTIN